MSTAPTYPPLPAPTVQPSPDSRNWALGAHLSAFAATFGIPSFVGPLVVWLVRKDLDGFAAAHAREALNFNLSVLLYAIAGVVATILTLGLGLVVLLPVALVAVPLWMVFTIIAAVKASNGEVYRYPLTIRFVS